MTKIKLWTKKEITTVERDYRDNPLYRAIAFGCLEWAAQADGFALSVPELFYHTIYSLDELRGIGLDSYADEIKMNRIEYCRLLWYQMQQYLTERTDAKENDIRNAASMVTIVVELCLYVYKGTSYQEEILQLDISTQKENCKIGLLMLKLFNDVVNDSCNQVLKTWLCHYVADNSFISDDIEDKLRILRETAAKEMQEQEILQRANIHSYYAPGAVNNDNRTLLTINQQPLGGNATQTLMNYE